MTKHPLNLTILILSAVVLVWQCDTTVRAQALDEEQGQVMLLKNGSILRGLVERTANHYSVHTRAGHRLDTAFDKGEFIADSLSEMYWRRLTHIGLRDAQGHENLFFWCLDQGLWTEANNQLEIFEAIELDSNKIDSFRRRLTQQRAERTRRPVNTVRAPSIDDSVTSARPTETRNIQPLSPIAEQSLSFQLRNEVQDLITFNPSADFFKHFEPEFRPLPSLVEYIPTGSQLIAAVSKPEIDGLSPHSDVIQVGYHVDSSVEIGSVITNEVETENVVSSKSARDDLSSRELEAFIKMLPKNSLGRFRNKAEPVLIAHCSNCHQLGSKDVVSLPLIFRGRLQELTIRMSERNLFAATQHIDAKHLESSPLLSSAITAHGGQDKPSLSPDSRAYLALADWVLLVGSQTESKRSLMGALQSIEDSAADRDSDDSTLGISSSVIPNLISQEPKRFEQPANTTELATEDALSRIDNRSTSNGSSSSSSGVLTPQPVSKTKMLTPAPPTVGEIPKLNQPQQQFIPRDEFDPEIFNRQFRHRYP